MKRKRKQPFTTGDCHHIFRLREHECTYPPAISTCAQWHLSRKCKSHKFWKDNDSKWTKVNISTQAILAFLKGVETWDNESCKSPHQWVMQQHEKVSHENPSVNFYYVLISAALSQGARGESQSSICHGSFLWMLLLCSNFTWSHVVRFLLLLST